MQGKLQLRASTRISSSSSPLKKSRRNLREKSHTEFYNNRISKLTNIFSEKGYTLDQLVTEDEILKCLDALGKEPYNRELAQQLFEKIPSNSGISSQGKRKFMLQDFIDTHIKAEYFLLLRAEEVEDELEDVYNEVANARDKLHGTLNQSEPIKTDSLQIDVLEVLCEDNEYEAEIGSIFSVILLVGDYKYETQEVVIDEPLFNPKFNWNFHFKLKNPNETVKVLLRDQRRHGRDENYSDLKCSFDLKNFMERTRYETWMALYNHFNQPTKFKVRLQIKWPPSQVEEIEQKIAGYQETEEKLNEEKEYIEASIKKLVHPFACAAAAIKAKRVSMGMRSEPNIVMGKQTSETPELAKSIENFKPGMNVMVSKQTSDTGSQGMRLGIQELGKINSTATEKAENSVSSQQYREQMGYSTNYMRGGHGPSGSETHEHLKKAVPLELVEDTQIINKGKLQMNRYSTEPTGLKQDSQAQGNYSGGYPYQRPGGVEGQAQISVQNNTNKQSEGFGFMHPGLSSMGNFGVRQTNAEAETIIRRTKQG